MPDAGKGPEIRDFVQARRHRENFRHFLASSRANFRTNGDAQLSGLFRQKIMETAGVAPFFHIPTSGGGNYYEYVQTTNIYQTTNPHVDRYVDKEKPLDDQAIIAFFMLNTNDDA